MDNLSVPSLLAFPIVTTVLLGVQSGHTVFVVKVFKIVTLTNVGLQTRLGHGIRTRAVNDSFLTRIF